MSHVPITWYTHSIAALTEALNSLPGIWLIPPYGTTSKALEYSSHGHLLHRAAGQGCSVVHTRHGP